MASSTEAGDGEARGDERLETWFRALEKRHLDDLTFQEVRRSIQALSARYVQRRGDALSGVLSTRGKRAAFALFYAPLHFLTVRTILRARPFRRPPPRIIDLGCGTGVAGAAWALECASRPSVAGFDLSPWAVEEARWNFRRLGVRGGASRRPVADVSLDDVSGVIAAYTINELSGEHRDVALRRLVHAAGRGAPVVIVEPISRRPVPWWDEWSDALGRVGGESHQWKLAVGMPDRLRLLDKAAGLDHRTLTARSIIVGGEASR